MKVRTALVLVVAWSAQGCSASPGCSDVGGYSGVAVQIPRALFLASGTVTLDVCDAADCASATQSLGPVPEGPVARAVNVSFDDLGRDFEPGPVTVTVTLAASDDTPVARTAQREVELLRSYPNGESCDGEGYVVGSVTLTAGDRLRDAR